MYNSYPPQEVVRTRRISLFWPIVLIGVGAILLLNNMNVLQGNVWQWIWRFWPILFIAWGLDGLLRRELIGPVLLLGLGIIFLLANFGWLALNPIDVILRLWPIFLVAGGISVLLDRRSTGTIGAAFGALLVLVILAAALWLVGVRFEGGPPVPGQPIAQSLDGAARANVTLEPAAGSLHLRAMSEPAGLIEGTVNLMGSETIDRNFSVDGNTAYYRLKGEGTFVGFTGGANWREWDLRLNPQVPVTLTVNLGAGDMGLDLRDLTLSRLNVNTAVGSATITMPVQGRVTGSVNGAVGSTTLVVPPGVGLRMQLSSGITVADVPSGYQRDGNTYTSAEFDNATARIELTVGQAIGSITVRDEVGR